MKDNSVVMESSRWMKKERMEVGVEGAGSGR